MLNKLNLLFSVTFLQKDGPMLSAASSGEINELADVMIDSGAHSNYALSLKYLSSQDKKHLKKIVPLQTYIDMCKKYFHGTVWQYIMLDVIKQRGESLQNLSEMVRQNLTPMPVLVIGQGVEEVPELMGVTGWLCVAGGVNAGGFDIRKRLVEVKNAGGENLKIHALGYAKIPQIFSDPLDSVDSSSWCGGGQFGHVSRYHQYRGFENMGWKELMGKGKSVNRQKQLKFLQYLQKELALTPQQVLDYRKHRTTTGITAVSTIYSYLKFAKHCEQHGIKYFFAVPGYTWLEALVGVMDNWTETGADYYKCVASAVELKNNRGTKKYLTKMRRMIQNGTN